MGTDSQRKALLQLRRAETKKSWWNRLIRTGFAVVLFEVYSGAWLLLDTGLSTRLMVLLLAHILLGYFLLVSAWLFLRRHREYSSAWPDPGQQRLAAGVLLLMITALGSGAFLHWWGLSGFAWVGTLHLLSSLTLPALMLLYAFRLVRFLSSSVDPQQKAGLDRQLRRVASAALLGFFLLFGVMELGGRGSYAPGPDTHPAGYSSSFSPPGKFYPSPMRTENNTFQLESYFTGSRSCGTARCHTEITRQWEDSTHYRTPGPFVSKVRELLEEESAKGEALPRTPSVAMEKLRKGGHGRELFRFCAGCHAPVSLLSGKIDPSRPMPAFTESEGLSCKLCHTMSTVKLRVGGAGNYATFPAPKLLFEDQSHPVLAHLYETIIRTRPGNHRQLFGRAEYKESHICSACHTTNQYESWLKGPYHVEGDPGKTKHCQSCHMPQVPTRDDISAITKGTIASHRFPSAGFTMATYFGLQEQLAATVKFIRDGKLRLELIAPPRLAASARGKLLVARVENVGVGHNFPSGPESDLIESWVQGELIGQDGKALFSFGALDGKGYLDAGKNKIWRTWDFDFTGRPVEGDRHRSWRFARDVSLVIPPRHFDDAEIPLPAELPAGHYELRARLMYRRPRQEFVDWVFGPGVFRAPAVAVAEATAKLELVHQLPPGPEREEFERRRRASTTAEGLPRNPGLIVDRRVSLEQKILMDRAENALREGETQESEALLRFLLAHRKNLHPFFVERLQRLERRQKQPRGLPQDNLDKADRDR